MTPEQHYTRAHVWSDRFDAVYSWADPVAYAGYMMVGFTLGALLIDSRAGAVGLVIMCWWLVMQRLHLLAGKLCTWRVKVHTQAFSKHAEASRDHQRD